MIRMVSLLFACILLGACNLKVDNNKVDLDNISSNSVSGSYVKLNNKLKVPSENNMNKVSKLNQDNIMKENKPIKSISDENYTKYFITKVTKGISDTETRYYVLSNLNCTTECNNFSNKDLCLKVCNKVKEKYNKLFYYYIEKKADLALSFPEKCLGISGITINPTIKKLLESYGLTGNINTPYCLFVYGYFSHCEDIKSYNKKIYDLCRDVKKFDLMFNSANLLNNVKSQGRDIVDFLYK